jgi:hypothetical protein
MPAKQKNTKAAATKKTGTQSAIKQQSPAVVIAAISATVALLRELFPIYQGFVRGGEITTEQQNQVKSDFESLKSRSGGELSGPEWETSGRT